LIYDRLDPDVAEYPKNNKPPPGIHWHRQLERDDFSSHRHPAPSFLLAHDLFRKPLHTPHQVRGRLFRDHALTENIGVRALVSRCYEVVGMSKDCHDMRELREKVARHYGRQLVQLSLALALPEPKVEAAN
jgi:hypothetical protein